MHRARVTTEGLHMGHCLVRGAVHGNNGMILVSQNPNTRWALEFDLGHGHMRARALGSRFTVLLERARRRRRLVGFTRHCNKWFRGVRREFARWAHRL